MSKKYTTKKGQIANAEKMDSSESRSLIMPESMSEEDVKTRQNNISLKRRGSDLIKEANIEGNDSMDNVKQHDQTECKEYD